MANYPAGTRYDSIRKHLSMNVGGGQMGENGLVENHLYHHLNIQPGVHLDEIPFHYARAVTGRPTGARLRTPLQRAMPT